MQSIDAIIGADSDVLELAVQVQVAVDARSPNEKEWRPWVDARFEPRGAESWPLHIALGITEEQPRSNCRLRATARDSRDAVIAEAQTVVSCERAAADDLRATLRLSEPDAAVVAPDPEESPDIAELCVDREVNVPFCEGESMRVCNASRTAAEVRPCAENELCITIGQNVQCACRPGFVQSDGGCVVPDCPHRDGGCGP